MANILRIPFEDLDGTLSPIVDEALAAGATADRGPVNGTTTFDVTFASKAKLNAFKAKLPAWATSEDVSTVEPQAPVPDTPPAE